MTKLATSRAHDCTVPMYGDPTTDDEIRAKLRAALKRIGANTRSMGLKYWWRNSMLQLLEQVNGGATREELRASWVNIRF